MKISETEYPGAGRVRQRYQHKPGSRSGETEFLYVAQSAANETHKVKKKVWSDKKKGAMA